MIEKPQIGMMVVSVSSKCPCNGFERGSVGHIAMIENNDQFLVRDHQTEDSFWHCRECVTKLK